MTTSNIDHEGIKEILIRWNDMSLIVAEKKVCEIFWNESYMIRIPENSYPGLPSLNFRNKNLWELKNDVRGFIHFRLKRNFADFKSGPTNEAIALIRVNRG
ncbi:MAG: hypothetical protein RLZZ230_551 [Candidatus Parcubacteria bacterium]|jgi:hypothetical protein